MTIRKRLPWEVEVLLYLSSWPSTNFKTKWWRLHAGYLREYRQHGSEGARTYASQARTAYAYLTLRRLVLLREWFDPGSFF